MGVCEAGSVLCPVIDVDMESLRNQDLIRIKMGLRDPGKLPIQTEITTSELFMYDLYFTLESVVEEG